MILAAEFVTGWALAHPAYVAIAAACTIVLIAFVLVMGAEERREKRAERGAHEAPRRGTRFRAGEARAGRRVLAGALRRPVTTITRAARRATSHARRLPGAIRRKLTPDLSTEDRITLGTLAAMRAEDTGGLRELHAPDPPAWAGPFAAIDPYVTGQPGRPVSGEPQDLVPGAGAFLLSPGYNSPPAQAEAMETPKVDSPAPETPVHLPWQRWAPLAVLNALTAPVRAHLEQLEHAERDALHAEALAAFPEWQPWPGDDTLTSMRAIKAEVA